MVDRYVDEAVGTLAKDSRGKVAMTVVTLRPRVTFVSFGDGKQPTVEALRALHHEAHDKCYIANSVLTEVRCEPQT